MSQSLSTAVGKNVPGPVKKSKWLQKKSDLLDHHQILDDLSKFTCKCRPSYCLTAADAAFVGQLRSTVVKLGTRSKVRIGSFNFLFK